jgi:hypothetical protein
MLKLMLHLCPYGKAENAQIYAANLRPNGKVENAQI